MQACELVELAAVVAVNGPVLVHGERQLSPESTEQYWSASKCRQDRWSRALKRYTQQMERGLLENRLGPWEGVRPVLEEILLGEVLTRIWTALAASHDRLRGACEAEPLARSVLVGQSEARNRALNLMVYGQGFGLEEAVELNRLRRRTERWTDMLLGYFAAEADLRDLSFEPERAAEFAVDLQRTSGAANVSPAWHLVQVSLRCAFQKGPFCPSPNVDLNAQIAASVIACLPPDIFDSTGLVKSLWLMRMEAKTDDTQGMLAELISIEDRSAQPRLTGPQRADGPHLGSRRPRF